MDDAGAESPAVLPANERTHELVRLVTTVAAAAGGVPVVAAALVSEWPIAVASSLVVLSGVFHSNYALQDPSARSVVQVADIGVAIFFTLVVCCRAQTHASLVGSLRLLWIVAIVSSTASYTTLQKLVPEVPLVPDDATIVALALTVFFLVAMAALARCRRGQGTRDPRFFVVELTLVAGSFALRFDDDLAKVLHASVGWACWYVCCHVAAVTALFLVRASRSEEP